MPTLKQITCSIAVGSDDSHVKEYHHRFTDGAVEAYIPVPSSGDQTFSVLVQSDGYIAPGLAAYVFIDGVYQANRNKLGLRSPIHTSNMHDCEIRFRFRQKEEIRSDGSILARRWSFARLPRSESHSSNSGLHSNVGKRIGVIEIVILRCSAPPAKLSKLSSGSSTQTPFERELRSKHTPDSSSTMLRADNTKTETPRQRSGAISDHQSGFGGLSGLFDGAGDDYPLKARISHDRRTGPRRTDNDHTRRSLNDSESSFADSLQYFRPRHHATRAYRVTNSSDNAYVGLQSISEGSFREHIRDTWHREQSYPKTMDSRNSSFAKPTSDELERLVFLHEQLRINNTQVQAVRKAKDVFERASKEKPRPYMQQLSTQKLEELDRQLQEVESKRKADTDFIFECLADMNAVQLSFASDVLREKDIILPSFEEVQEWYRRKNNQVKAELPPEESTEPPQDISAEQSQEEPTEQQDGNNEWEQVGEGAVNGDASKRSDNAGWQQVGEGTTNGFNTGQEAGDNSWNKPDEEKDATAWGGAGDENYNRTQSEHHSKSCDKSNHSTHSKIKSMTSRKSSRQNEASGCEHQEDQNQDGNLESTGRQTSQSKVSSKKSARTPTLPITSYATSEEPKREIKPYWSNWRHGITTSDCDSYKTKQGSRESSGYPAPSTTTLSASSPKGAGHGLQLGKSTAYAHVTSKPEYIDNMQNPYAVFVFRYHSREMLEKILGKTLGHEDNVKGDSEKEKDELVREMLKSKHRDKNRKPSKSSRSHASGSHTSEDEIRPEDSVSQIVSSDKTTIVNSSHHRQSERHDNDREATKSDRSVKETQNWEGEQNNRWDGNKSNAWEGDQGETRKSKSSKSSEKSFEHFPGQAMKTTGDVAW